METYYDRALRMQKINHKWILEQQNQQKVTYQSQFENSKAAMMYMGSWYMGTLLTNIDDGKTNVEWGLPNTTTRKGKATTFGSPTSFAINKNSKNKKLLKNS